ncbi:hypothetical protein EJB05_34796, partial [Eragrostis curvula]
MASQDGDRRELLAAVRGRLAAAVKGRVAAPVEKVESGGRGFRNVYPRELLALSRQMRLPGPLAEELREVRREPTYASASIEECLASGNQIHQSAQQRTPNTMPTPNYASSYSLTDRVDIDALLSKLCSPDPAEQKSAVAELRLLAKQNASNRLCIAEAGAIPLLLNLLSSSDLQTQVHAITALLNLSLHVDNKERIISSGAVPSIVHVLVNGNTEARENAAATFLSLSVIDKYKVTIGETGAVPALVVLLSEGTQGGKKDAAAALFNLCTYEGNKAYAVRAGLVSLIMGLLTTGALRVEQGARLVCSSGWECSHPGALMNEATAILPVLSSHPEGKAAIWAAEPVRVLVEMISSESRRDSECAAKVMLHLCSDEQKLKQLACLPECRIMVTPQRLSKRLTFQNNWTVVQERLQNLKSLQHAISPSNTSVPSWSNQLEPSHSSQLHLNEADSTIHHKFSSLDYH